MVKNGCHVTSVAGVTCTATKGVYMANVDETREDVVDPYRMTDGIFRPPVPVQHREEEYRSASFDSLRDMQAKHFWYRGRHRFLACALRRYLARHNGCTRPRPRLIDLGCGCGGWMSEVSSIVQSTEVELAIADSSMRALEYAGTVLLNTVSRYQIDLLDLQWRNRWDVVFLLDVLEHLPDDARALKQVYNALSPGGLLFVTVPAFMCFWTWNDEMANHQRRYRRRDFAKLANETGFILHDARYFMFFLAPLLLASRWLTRHKVARSTPEDARRISKSMHRVPHPVINSVLKTLFAMETPLGHYVRFPWGTSMLGVFQKPSPGRMEQS